tara:strand:+ start:368 stop:742 length:375 start_codon:yes stop_codon:yes gene_type:complete
VRRKLLIVFDFQHPTERYLYEVDSLPFAEKDYRFFEKGNHFSKNIYVRYCKAEEVNDYLPMFTTYLLYYKQLIEKGKPTGEDTTHYHDFDKYMIKLDPISGYLGSAFGKEESEQLIKEFFFSYA